MKRPRRRLLLVATLVVMIAAAVAVIVEPLDLLFYHRPIEYGAGFHEAIRRADRIVVRDGGFDCHGSVAGDPVLVVITDPAEVKAVAQHLAFVSRTTTNSIEESCMCCGGPGLDWYRGRSRLALTALQHGRGLRWRGFSTGRVLGVTVGHGDAPLTEASAAWLAEWLTTRAGRASSL